MCSYAGVWEALAAGWALAVGTPARAAALIGAGAEVPAPASQPPPLPLPFARPALSRSRRLRSRRLGSPRTCLRVLTPVRRCAPAACPWARVLPVLQQLPHAPTGLGTHFGKAHACAHLRSHVTGIRTALTCARAASPARRLPCAFPCTRLTCCHAVNYLPLCNPPPPPQNPGQLKCCNIVAA